jgi:hypothetical protein
MDDALKWLTTLLGGGGVTLLLFYGVRGAIAAAVTQAANRETEGLKARFASELEEKRQAFARDLERERGAAARDLEGFKATLTLRAETRRQLAAKRLEVFGEIVAKGDATESLIQDRDRPGAQAALNDVVTFVRRNLHLFSADTEVRLTAYLAKIGTWHLLDGHPPSDVVQRVFTEFREAMGGLRQVIRRELEIEASDTARKGDT